VPRAAKTMWPSANVRNCPKSEHTLAQLMSSLATSGHLARLADGLIFEFELFGLPYYAPDPRLGHSR
jgi:hypothetical protein